MNEHDQYIQYIEACRAGNQKIINKMLNEGFKPSAPRLSHLAKTHADIRNLIVNDYIIIKIDAGHIAGHVYVDYPSSDDVTSRKQVGFYPSKSGIRALYGPGRIKDEVNESGRVLENLQTVVTTLQVPQEMSSKLDRWRNVQANEPLTFFILNNNCITFAHEFAKQAGHVDGLVDKFNPAEIKQLDFKPIKLGLIPYFRDEPKSTVVKVSNLDPYYKAISKEEADHFTLDNHIHVFFNQYHPPEFYRNFFKGKSITKNDELWIYSNHLPSLFNSSSYSGPISPYLMQHKFLTACNFSFLDYSLHSSFSPSIDSIFGTDWNELILQSNKVSENGNSSNSSASVSPSSSTPQTSPNSPGCSSSTFSQKKSEHVQKQPEDRIKSECDYRLQFPNKGTAAKNTPIASFDFRFSFNKSHTPSHSLLVDYSAFINSRDRKVKQSRRDALLQSLKEHAEQVLTKNSTAIPHKPGVNSQTISSGFHPPIRSFWSQKREVNLTPSATVKTSKVKTATVKTLKKR